MMKNIIVVTFTLFFVLMFSTELSYSQRVNKQHNQLIENKPIALVEESINFNIIKKEENNNHIMIMEASAYTKSVEEGTYKGITKSGTQVSRGTVSVDPRIIPLKTRLYIEDYGEAIALDTGGAIKGNRIDLYMDTKKEALEFGRRDVKVIIIK